MEAARPQASGAYRRGLRAPAPCGYFALGGKVTKTPLGAPQTPFCPIGHQQGRYRAATEILRLRLPRNRCGEYLTSAVAPRAAGWLCDGCFEEKPYRGISVAAQNSFYPDRLGKSGGPARRGLALFPSTFVRTKVDPPEANSLKG